MPPPKRAKPARNSARCGVGDGSPHPPSPHPQPVGSGRRQPAQRTGGRLWESAQPRTPHSQARGAPPYRAASRSPHSAQIQLRRARAVELVTGPHHRTRPARENRGSGPWRPGAWTGGWRRGSAQLWTPHTRARGAPLGAPSCCPPRAFAVGIVTGHHARIPRARGNKGSGPRPPAPRMDGRGRGSAQPRPPSTPLGNKIGDARAGPPPPTPPTTGRGREPSRNHGGGRTALKGPTSDLRGDHTKDARQTATEGGETPPPRMREHTNRQRTRGAYLKGSLTKLAEPTDHMESCTSTRGQGTPRRGNLLQKSRGTRGTDSEGGGQREAAPAPLSQPAASAAHTPTGHYTLQGTSGAQRYAPTPGYAASARAHGGPTSNKPARARQRRHPGRPRIRGAVYVGKRPQPRLLSDTLSGEWGNAKAGGEHGFEPREPRGLRHQAEGVSGSTPH